MSNVALKTPVSPLPSFKESLTETQNLVQKRLESIMDKACKGVPIKLADAMRHGVLNGGKRIRPYLHLMAARLFGGDERVALDIALDIGCAIELVHCYSLIHDDLPCMDDANLRRGKPTAHILFGEADALLAGNALLATAFDVISELPLESEIKLQLIRELSQASGAHGMMGGQHLDLLAETQSDLSFEEVSQIQDLKTGALFAVSLRTAAIAFEGNDHDLDRLTTYANCFGRIFQITDDLLDVEGCVLQAGKDLKSDHNKQTFVSLLGVEKAREMASDLVDKACDILSPYNENATPLMDAARFLLGRVG